MKKYFLLSVLAMGLGLNAQTVDNLNLLNTRGLHGTPRYTAMGGAFTALGNDFSAIHLNPAGASVYRHDQLGISLGFQGQRDETSFLGSRNEASNFNVLFENVGLVKKFGRDVPLTFSVSYNKMADFNSEFTASGVNQYQPGNQNQPESGFTLGEYWLSGVRDLTIPEMESMGFFEEASAADATVLLVDSIGAFIYDYYPDSESNVSYVYEERGSHNEVQLSLGSQVEDRFHYAFSIGIPTLNYRRSTRLNESGFADSSFITNYALNRSNEVYGTGINFKVGIIGKPSQWLRVGLSYQSPSWYSVSEVYSVSVDAFSPNETFRGTEYIFDDIQYVVRTPGIFRGGAAVVIAKSALISVDYEYSDASNINLSTRDGNNYEEAEDDFTNAARATNTIKVGAEYRIGPTYLRGGVQYRESNFEDTDFYYSNRTSYSAGFGYKNRDFSIDLAYVWSGYSNNYSVHPYLGNNLDGEGVVNPERTLVESDITKGNIVLGASFSL